jgi:hypothetical protein
MADDNDNVVPFSRPSRVTAREAQAAAIWAAQIGRGASAEVVRCEPEKGDDGPRAYLAVEFDGCGYHAVRTGPKAWDVACGGRLNGCHPDDYWESTAPTLAAALALIAVPPPAA